MSLVPILTPNDDLSRWRKRRPRQDQSLVENVSRIVQEVESEGAAAVLRHTRQFDAPDLGSIWLSKYELHSASIPAEALDALRTAIERVRDFHEIQLSTLTHDLQELELGYAWRTDVTDDDETGFEGQRILPLQRVGVYVPGGQATYPSSVYMNVIPAQVAGVEEVVVATPPGKDGKVPEAVLVACRELGIEKILLAGGASAISALAIGWEGFERVDKIVGPGNRFVNEAKRQLWGSVGLDCYAGPSEVCVVVDERANPEQAAYDLLTQIEHAPDNVALLIGTSRETLTEVLDKAESILQTAERREIMTTALQEQGCVVWVSDLDEAIGLVNDFAPEHLTLMVEDPGSWVPKIRNAGCILMGSHSPQALGDYVSGPCHTLPTSGAARFASPVSVSDFHKIQSLSMLSASDLAVLAPIAENLAKLEGLPLHGQAGIQRLQS
ncbi:MAG: histidinol dehydrogenase [Fimbriimonadaceae bacterium]|nr:histidinol dehydrogenase [Fimbriimonadaceae bacterium]